MYIIGQPLSGNHMRPLALLIICSAMQCCACAVWLWVDTSGPYWSWDYLTDQLPVTLSGCNQPDLNGLSIRLTTVPLCPKVTWARPSQAHVGAGSRVNRRRVRPIIAMRFVAIHPQLGHSSETSLNVASF